MKQAKSDCPITDPKELRRLAKTSARKRVALNPNIPLDLAAKLAYSCPEEIAQNPMVPIWELTEPNSADFRKVMACLQRLEILEIAKTATVKQQVGWLWLITRRFAVWKMYMPQQAALAVQEFLTQGSSVEKLQCVNTAELAAIPQIKGRQTSTYDAEAWAPMVLMGYVLRQEKPMNEFSMHWFSSWFDYLELRGHIALFREMLGWTTERFKEEVLR